MLRFRDIRILTDLETSAHAPCPLQLSEMIIWHLLVYLVLKKDFLMRFTSSLTFRFWYAANLKVSVDYCDTDTHTFSAALWKPCWHISTHWSQSILRSWLYIVSMYNCYAACLYHWHQFNYQVDGNLKFKLRLSFNLNLLPLLRQGSILGIRY